MARGKQRPVAQVPALVLGVLAAALTVQITLKLLQPAATPQTSDLPDPAPRAALHFASFGDPVPAAKVLMLWLQGYDYRAGNRVPYQALDYARLEGWLRRILEMDPAGQYPLMAASRLYANVPQAAKQRQMLDFVYEEFLVDPDRRWPWLADAAAVAKHRLNDMALARKYAAAIQQHATGESVPIWARQMEAFILEDMDELETARIMIGGFIEKGMAASPGELRFLEQRLKEIEARIKAPK
jgi:hypothetical protein